MRRPVVVASLAAAAGVAAALLLMRDSPAATDEEVVRVCRSCGSTHMSRTYTVDGAAVRRSDETAPSAVLADLLGDGHAHVWAVDYVNTESPSGFTHGDFFPHHTGPMPSRFAAAYNGDAGFRRLVQARVAAGALSRDLAGRMALADLDDGSEAASGARALLDEFFGPR